MTTLSLLLLARLHMTTVMGLLLFPQGHSEAPKTDPAGAAAPPCPADARGRRLVIANLYGLGWSILSGVPSGEVSVFLGSSLRTRWDRWGQAWKTALGYELSGSAGGADYATASYSWGGDYGVAYHRHHLAALGYGARGDRLYYHFGGGLLIWRTRPIALEADLRLGVTLGTRRKTRIKGVVGGHARIVGIIGGVPIPQFGVFAGFFVF
jgi:hypothetical protein